VKLQYAIALKTQKVLMTCIKSTKQGSASVEM